VFERYAVDASSGETLDVVGMISVLRRKDYQVPYTGRNDACAGTAQITTIAKFTFE
jgi:hypothetical protein